MSFNVHPARVTANSQQRIATTFGSVFGADFAVQTADDRDTSMPLRADFGDQSEYNERVLISQIQEFLWDVTVLEIRDGGYTYTANGQLAALNRDSIVRMAVAARRLLILESNEQQLNEEMICYMEQASNDLEEACWFRSMAEQVAECKANDPLENLCRRILPQLRELVHARAVVYLEEPPASAVSGLFAFDAEQEHPHFSADTIRNLVNNYGDGGSNSACIRNNSFLSETGAPEEVIGEGICEFVLVRVGTSSQHFGWLLALNRQDAVGTPTESRIGEVEFGTHEATLLETAAVLMATHASNGELFDEQERTLVGMVTAMVNALDARDPYTRGHSQRVAQVAQCVGGHLGLSNDECEGIYLSGLLHDIGKIGVADAVLLKNGPLDAEERRQIEQHTVIGHSILHPVEKLAHVLPGVIHHHERYDGEGYPSRLKGESIPLVGRILAVADAYDAMTTSRPYRSAMPIEKAEAILVDGAGSHWDKAVVDAFFEIRDEIEQIYRDDCRHHSSRRISVLQHGRFEDVSQGAMLNGTQLAPCET